MKLRRLWNSIKWQFYVFRCWVWHRYNVIEVKTLPSTWCDRDYFLLHVAFQVLVDFVELEKPFEYWDTEASDHAADWIELRALYDWWKNYDYRWHDDYELETIKLIELCRLRKMLWT